MLTINNVTVWGIDIIYNCLYSRQIGKPVFVFVPLDMMVQKQNQTLISFIFRIMPMSLIEIFLAGILLL